MRPISIDQGRRWRRPTGARGVALSELNYKAIDETLACLHEVALVGAPEQGE